MKLSSLALFSLLLLQISLPCFSQSTDCSLFCTSLVRLDAEQGNLLVTIYNGDSSGTQLNYPYVAFVLDSQGDTLAKGDFRNSFYAHMGGSVLTYVVPTSRTQLPEGGDFLVHLTYTDLIDDRRVISCPLPFPTTATDAYCHATALQLHISPNPGKDHTTIRFDNPRLLRHTLTIYDLEGRVVWVKTDITQDKVRITRKILPESGIYLARIERDGETYEVGKFTLY